jgi:hypothetical protein
MQALQKAAAQRKLDEGGAPISPGGTKQKLVPISALIPAPRIDADAPDLGKEVTVHIYTYIISIYIFIHMCHILLGKSAVCPTLAADL